MKESSNRMRCFCKAVKPTLFALALGMVFSISASGQSPLAPNVASPQPNEQADPDTGLHVDVTPYLWFAGLNGTTGVLGHDASVHASFSDIFNYFNIGAMGLAEVRHNRVIIPLDFMWMKLSDKRALPLNDAQAESIKAEMTETMLAQKIGY